MSRSLPVRGLAVALAVLILDQLVKWAVTVPLGLNSDGMSRVLLPVFSLNYVANCGVSLGLLRTDTVLARWALVALTGGIAAGVLVWLTRERNRVDQLALGAVFGGALGNIADRLVSHPAIHRVFDPVRYPGCVTDYADLHFGEWRPFLVFNLADAAITVGVLVLLVRAMLTREAKPRASVEKSNA